MAKTRKKRTSPYQKYHIILEEKEEKFVSFARKTNSMLLAIVAPLFLPAGSVDLPDSIAISREESMGLSHVIDDVQKDTGLPPKLILLIETIGGVGVFAYSIARLLRKRFEEIIVFVLRSALSAGTLIACAGDEIVMDDSSYLGPFDAQMDTEKYGYISAAAVRKGVVDSEKYYRRRGVPDPQKFVADRIDPIVRGLLEDAQKAGELYLTEILKLARYDQKAIKRIVRKLVWEYPTHEFPVTMEIARDLGLRISPRSKYPELWSMMEEWLDKLIFHPDNEDHLVAYTRPRKRS